MIIIGNKINGAIPSVAKAIADKNTNYIRNLAKVQSAAGSDFIDVCANVDLNMELDTLKWLISLIQDVTDTPICINSPHATSCIEAMKYCERPGLINSISGDKNKIDIIFPAIADTDWQCIALLCDDSGVSKTTVKRLEVFDLIMKNALQFNIAPTSLHIDPMADMLRTSENGITLIIDVIKAIKAMYPLIHVTGGFGNISFNLPSRNYIDQAFCVLAMSAGMDSGILDPTNENLMGIIEATKALLGHDPYCMNYIDNYRKGFLIQKSNSLQ